MGAYRETRNIEASLIEKIENILTENKWNNVEVVKSFARAYSIPINPDEKTAVICIRVGVTTHNSIEVGSDSTFRKPLLLIDLFASSDGQKEDLTDTLVAELKKGWDYTEYTIADGAVESRVRNGKIQVSSLTIAPINFDIDKDQLLPHDRYRNLITLNCIKNSVEE